MKFRITQMRFWTGISIFCLMIATTSTVLAADISIGAGAGIAPDYEGSDDYEFVPIPFAKVAFENGMFATIEGLTARVNLIPSDFWRLGPVYNYRSQRSDVDNRRVDRLKNISDANELGAFGGFQWNRWSLLAEYKADIGDAHDGWLATLRGGYTYVASKSWTLSFGLSTTYASDDYMSTYFGVDADDAARSGLDEYDADSGIKDVGFDLGIDCQFTDHWGGRLLGSYNMLVGDADDDSPVTDEGSEHQFFLGLLVIYTF